MELKNILVHVDASERASERIEIAAAMAQAGDAHLTGLFVIPDSLMYPGYTVSAYLFLEQMEEARANSRTAEKTFHSVADSKGVHREWRSEEGQPSRVVARHARYADLAVVGKGDAKDTTRFPYPELAADLVMTCGRPVLIVPNAGHFETVGRRILVCWNASRESTRTINDSLPLLRAAEHVTVLSVNPAEASDDDHGDIPSADIALHLARHGVNVAAASTTADGIDVANMILSRVSDLAIDLIVTGAYGHSRTREWVFGGVTPDAHAKRHGPHAHVPLNGDQEQGRKWPPFRAHGRPVVDRVVRHAVHARPGGIHFRWDGKFPRQVRCVIVSAARRTGSGIDINTLRARPLNLRSRDFRTSRMARKGSDKFRAVRPISKTPSSL